MILLRTSHLKGDEVIACRKHIARDYILFEIFNSSGSCALFHISF